MEKTHKMIYICYCCKKKREGKNIIITTAETNKIKNSDYDMNVETRFVCKKCNHIKGM